VFLFDEPLSNLDAKLRAQTRLEIQKLHRELGITSLFVTHDQVEAMTLAQRMLVMNAGRMEQFGTPQEVYEQPASTFVAGFIGSPPMNLLRHARGVPEGRILGIRPEHVRLSTQIDGNGWQARVEAQEMLGAERLIYVRLGEEQVIVRTEEEAPVPPLGSDVQLTPRADRLHWFDAASGQRCEDPFAPARNENHAQA
jgi:sn-glycerol 3-phosphate transport system ATP-binding protein